jgi:hypothetical protein
MPNTPTPGQLAYDVWRLALQQTVGYWSPYVYATWNVLRPVEQAAWEAAAQAVRAGQDPPARLACPACGAHDIAILHELAGTTVLRRPCVCECCGATWVQVYTLARADELRRPPPAEDLDHAHRQAT